LSQPGATQQILKSWVAAAGRRHTGESVEVSAESMVEAIQGKHIEFVATEIPFLRNMMEQAQTLSQLMMKLDWEILIAASGTGFLICDSPFVIVPPQGSAEVGLLVPGAVKYFPADPWSVPAARAARTGAPQSKPMASSTGWCTTLTALRCAATRCARIAGSRTHRALTRRDR